MIKRKIIIILAITTSLLFGCGNTKTLTTELNIDKNVTEGVTKQNYDFYLDGSEYKTQYSIGANTDANPPEFRTEKMLLVSDDDIINLSFATGTSLKEIALVLYYDYKQIDFKIKGAEKFTDEYRFPLEDNQEIIIPVILDPELPKDDKIHKLMFSFIAGAQQNASDFKQVTNRYGMTTIFDIVYTKDFKNEVACNFDYTPIVPTSNFEMNSGPLLLNFDYKNEEQKKGKGFLYPPSEMKVKKGSNLAIMYNIEKKPGLSNVALIFALDFKQYPTDDGELIKVINLDGDNGTANGKVNIQVPHISGKYELVSYLVEEPFERQNIDSSEVPTGERITLTVE